MQKKQLNVRISCELHDKIEATGHSKQSVVFDALELYFNGGSRQEDNAAYVQQLDAKDRQIAELHVMLQTSITNQPKSLPLPPPNRWWKFWQKSPEIAGTITSGRRGELHLLITTNLVVPSAVSTSIPRYAHT